MNLYQQSLNFRGKKAIVCHQKIDRDSCELEYKPRRKVEFSVTRFRLLFEVPAILDKQVEIVSLIQAILSRDHHIQSPFKFCHYPLPVDNIVSEGCLYARHDSWLNTTFRRGREKGSIPILLLEKVSVLTVLCRIGN